MDEYPDYESRSPLSGPNSREAVLLTDSVLPYRRLLRENEAKNIAAQLALLEQETSSGSDRASSHTLNSRSDTSRSSDPTSPDEPRVKKNEVTPVDSSDSSMFNDSSDASTPQRKNKNYSRNLHLKHDAIHSPNRASSRAKSSTPTEQPQAPAIPARNPNRPATPSRNEPQLHAKRQSDEIHPPVSPPPRTPKRGRPELETLRRLIPPPLPSHHVGLRPKPVISSEHSETSSSSDERPRTPKFEKVEGITLDTQPIAAKQAQTGLSIPEVEAKDVRNIPSPTPDDEFGGADSEAEYEALTANFAKAPRIVQVGTRKDRGRASPPSNKSQQDPLTGDDPRAEKDVMSRPLVASERNFPPVQETPEQIVEQPAPSQNAKHSRRGRSSSFRDPSIPTPIPEVSREDLLDAKDSDSDDEDSAAPPPIALTADPEHKRGDPPIARGLQAAKSMISGIF